MEIDGVYTDEVVFSVMFPSTFASMHHISVHDMRDGTQVLRAVCNPEDIQEIREVETRLLAELRNCSRRTFSGFRDEYDAMFVSSIVEDSSGDVEFQLHHTGDFEHLRSGDGDAVDCSITPVTVTVRPGSASVSWAFSPVDDPTSFEIPGVLRANEAIARATRARRAIERLEDRVRENVQSADQVITFLEQHNFPRTETEIE